MNTPKYLVEFLYTGQKGKYFDTFNHLWVPYYASEFTVSLAAVGASSFPSRFLFNMQYYSNEKKCFENFQSRKKRFRINSFEEMCTLKLMPNATTTPNVHLKWLEAYQPGLIFLSVLLNVIRQNPTL